MEKIIKIMNYEDLIKALVMAGTILVAGSFSLWYSLYLSLKRRVSFKYPFYITLVSYVFIGLARLVLKYVSPDFKGLPVIFLVVGLGLALETYLVKQIYNISLLLALITTIIAFIVSIIIVVPLIVSAGFVLSYITAPVGFNSAH
jgi:hypothetical protein